MKIAVVHDQLQEFGGAERVLVSLIRIFPEADVFTSFYNPGSLGIHASLFKNKRIHTSWADKIPFLKNLYSPLRFITPLIWESFDFSAYDLVISSSGSYMSKGIVTKPGTIHVCYLHHPPRYLYNYETAIEWQKYKLIKIYGNLINHNLRMWDYLSSQRVNYFLANSEETKRRIRKFYKRDAQVVYPPVSIPRNWKPEENNKTYYLTVSRLARAKHVDVLIRAANKYKFRLKVVGTGRDESYLKKIAGETVEFLGSVSDTDFPELYQHAKVFLFASVDEEFGIAPVEAMGYGVPVIAFRSGGLPEIVKHGENGFLYDSLDEISLYEKIREFEKLSNEQHRRFMENARKTSEHFSEEKFKQNLLKHLSSLLPNSSF